MLGITHRATSCVESIDINGVGIVLLVDLEAQVSIVNVVKVRHLISIYWQASNSHHVLQCRAYHVE